MESTQTKELKEIKNKKKRKTGIPKFLRFLYSMLTYNDNFKNNEKNILYWINNGTAFQINNINYFEKYILCQYFKHKSMASFQRQLNYFGFRKWTKKQTSICTFSHPYFIKGRIENLKIIANFRKNFIHSDSTYSSLSSNINNNKNNSIFHPFYTTDNIEKSNLNNRISSLNYHKITKLIHVSDSLKDNQSRINYLRQNNQNKTTNTNFKVDNTLITRKLMKHYNKSINIPLLNQYPSPSYGHITSQPIMWIMSNNNNINKNQFYTFSQKENISYYKPYYSHYPLKNMDSYNNQYHNNLIHKTESIINDTDSFVRTNDEDESLDDETFTVLDNLPFNDEEKKSNENILLETYYDHLHLNCIRY